MQNRISDRCELLVRNKEVLSKVFKWEHDYIAIATAAVFTSAGKLAEVEKIKAADAILKKNTSIFSSFRGYSQAVITSKMALNENPEGYLTSVMDVYKIINGKKLIESEYKIMAAMTIVDCAKPEDYERVIDKTIEIYQRMRKEHSFLTGSEDIPFAAMLALTDKSVDELIVDMEKSFGLLKSNFFSKDSVQALSHVLTLNDAFPEQKCEKTMQIFEEFKKAKHKYGANYELATLGTLATIDMTPEQIVNYVIQADETLKKVKGFGNIWLGAENRRMLASLIVLSAYGVDSSTASDSIVSTLVTLTIQIEAAIMLCIVSATIASSTT